MTNNSVTAWHQFCDSLREAGEFLAGDEFPNSSQTDQAEGVRHLSRMTILALTQFVEANNTEFPRFVRQNDDVTQWGGNNLDNGYYIAHVDQSSDYRIYGNASSASGFILSARDGYMHENKLACKDLSSANMQIDDDGNFEVIVSQTEQAGNWLEMIPGTTQLGIRVYYYNWETETPPVFQLVKIGNEGLSPPRLSEQLLVDNLGQAGEWLQCNLLYWNKWMKDRAPHLPVNRVSKPHSVPGGSNEVITYSGGRYEIGDDEALVVTFEPINAEYLGFMLYTDAWFETMDMHNRLGGFNNQQLAVDTDGRIRVVITAHDPGVNNWIDNEARSKGLMTLRTINGDVPPETSSRLVKISELGAVLPTDTCRLNLQQRREQIMTRREHMVSRFHR
ncbi:MAG: DUF1214 domain-containing protein [Pseudomonadales bacterium]